jgi:hypothetical protein
MATGACSKGSACGCSAVPASESPADAALDTCSGGEAFALRVLGDSMEPEFREGEISRTSVVARLAPEDVLQRGSRAAHDPGQGDE